VQRDERFRGPGSVRAAGVLTALAAVANVVVGVVLVGLVVVGTLPQEGGRARGTLVAAGVGYCLLGAVTLLGVPAVLGGRPGGRVFVTVLMTVRIVAACVSFGLLGTWYSAGSAVGLVLSVLVVALLWDSRANAFFHRAD
jgi:hypothetical protein